MGQAPATMPQAVVGRSRAEAAAFAMAVVGTAAVWGHTMDEIRIGEISAIPAGLLNLALLARWKRIGRRARGWLTLAFGLFWTVTVIPYHVIPLLQGMSTWQNVSGLLRVVGGVGMVVAGITLLRGNADHGSETSPEGMV